VVTTQTAQTQQGFIPVQRPGDTPQALLWLNPFVGDLDLICTTAPGGYDGTSCDYVAAVTGTPFFATPQANACPPDAFCTQPATASGVGVGISQAPPPMPAPAIAVKGVTLGAAVAPATTDAVAPPDQQAIPTFGFPRDTFWPRNALAFVLVGVVLTLLSAQLVAPTRRLRLRRPRRAGGAIDPITWGTHATAAASDARPPAGPPSPAAPSDAPLPTDEVPR